jgi:hypothetical protein
LKQLLQRRCDARGFGPLPIEIIAKRKVALAFEQARDRAPEPPMQFSVWRMAKSLALVTRPNVSNGRTDCAPASIALGRTGVWEKAIMPNVRNNAFLMALIPIVTSRRARLSWTA